MVVLTVRASIAPDSLRGDALDRPHGVAVLAVAHDLLAGVLDARQRPAQLAQQAAVLAAVHVLAGERGAPAAAAALAIVAEHVHALAHQVRLQVGATPEHAWMVRCRTVASFPARPVLAGRPPRDTIGAH